MQLKRAFSLWLLLGLSAGALASGGQSLPGVLIVRLKPAKGVVPLDTAICDLVANELQADGRTVPIVWSITDTIYRSAVTSGAIPSGIETPTLDEAVGVAKKLRAVYVLATDLRGGKDKIQSAAYLYRNGKLVWQDPNIDLNAALAHDRDLLRRKQISPQEFDQRVVEASHRTSSIQFGNQFRYDDTLKSLARTWVEMMGSGPFQGLEKRTEKVTPDPGKGDAPPNATTGTVVTPKEDTRWNTEVSAALKAGDANRAVSLLRDAIDASPMDISRRVLLVKTLMHYGQPEIAAREARRAAELMPDRVELRAWAARGWIQADRTDEAQSDLNEAVARAPDSSETRMLLADVAIAKGDFGSAVGHLDKAIAIAPTGDAYYLRALAHAMGGDMELADADAKKANEAGLSQDPEDAESRYSLVATLLDGGLTSIGGELRTLHSRAQVQRADKEVKQTFADLMKRVTGQANFVSGLPTPKGHELSHNRRVLAYKLLSQCLSDLGSYMKNGDEDVLTESRINLGEALKQGASARQRFKDEQQGIKKSDGKPG